MKIWIISDTHIGFNNGNREWFGIFDDCYRNFLLPLFRENAGRDDILVHCGDVFEERQSINLFAITTGVSVFEEFGRIFSGVHVICGNHDVQNDRNNDITSLDCLKYIDNISVYRKPARLEVSGKNISLVPWEKDNAKFLRTMQEHAGSDYVFCHADILGATMNASKTKSKSGVDAGSLKSIKKIYSGHIHNRHDYKNITFVGSPYSMTFNDVDNKKGVYSIDLETGETVFHPNNVSPEFKRVAYGEIVKKDMDAVRSVLGNNFVELMVMPGDTDTKRYQNFVREADLNGGARNMEPKYAAGAEEVINMEVAGISETMTLEEMTYAYVDNVLECDSRDTKDKVKTIIGRLFKQNG